MNSLLRKLQLKNSRFIVSSLPVYTQSWEQLTQNCHKCKIIIISTVHTNDGWRGVSMVRALPEPCIEYVANISHTK